MPPQRVLELPSQLRRRQVRRRGQLRADARGPRVLRRRTIALFVTLSSWRRRLLIRHRRWRNSRCSASLHHLLPSGLQEFAPKSVIRAGAELSSA